MRVCVCVLLIKKIGMTCIIILSNKPIQKGKCVFSAIEYTKFPLNISNMEFLSVYISVEKNDGKYHFFCKKQKLIESIIM